MGVVCSPAVNTAAVDAASSVVRAPVLNRERSVWFVVAFVVVVVDVDAGRLAYPLFPKGPDFDRPIGYLKKRKKTTLLDAIF